MADKPTHDLVVIIPETSDTKARWVKLCPLWEQKDGDLGGMLDVLPLPVLAGQSVRLVVQARKSRDAGGGRG